MHALVTGSNRGIGLELVKQLCRLSWTVYAACRSPSPSLKELNLNGGRIIEGRYTRIGETLLFFYSLYMIQESTCLQRNL